MKSHRLIVLFGLLVLAACSDPAGPAIPEPEEEEEEDPGPSQGISSGTIHPNGFFVVPV